MKVDDPRLNQLISKGNDGDIVIVGCPFDFYRKRCLNKGGEELGPDCLRRFYHKVGPLINPEYKVDIGGLKVSDSGDIHVKMEKEEQERKFKQVQSRKFKGEFVNYEKNSPELIIQRISQTLSNLLHNKQTPFVLGGSKECILGSVRSMFGLYEDGEMMFLCGKPFLRRPYDGNKGTSDNILTVIKDEFPQRNITLFGTQKAYFPCQYMKEGEVDTSKLGSVKLVQLKHIREVSVHQRQLGASTQAYFKMKQTLTKQPVLICVSVQVMERFLGCRDVLPMGITIEQIMQIFYFLGTCSNVKCICISQFNPSCEDYQSSLLLLNMLYYFLMGKATKS